MRLTTLLLCLAAGAACADAPEIVEITAAPGADTWRFSVTLRHADTGWDHYADGWRVESADGTILGYRELLHPHVQEQPFTRWLSGVVIDPSVTQVFIRARDNLDGWAAERTPFDLP